MIEALFLSDSKSPWDEQVIAAMFLLGADAEKMAVSAEQKICVGTGIKFLRDLPEDSAKELALEILIQGGTKSQERGE